jgi:hypothetical protein
MAVLHVGSGSVRSSSSCLPAGKAGPGRASVRRSLLSLAALVIVALTSFISGCKGTITPVGNVILVITPSGNVNVPLGGTQLFTVTTSGSTDTGIFWEVNGNLGGDTGNSACGCGTITQETSTSPGGLYTPPAIIPVPNTVSIAAVAHVNNNDVITATVVLVSSITVAVSPASSDLILGQSQPLQLNAAVTGTSNKNVTWQVANGATGFGTITSGGLYSPPSTVTGALPVTVGVTATSTVDTTKSATVNIVLHSAMKVAVSPNPATVQTFGSQQFAATVTGGSSAVTWEVNGIAGGNAAIGNISQTGLYTAPNSVPTRASGTITLTAPVTVQAVSQEDSFFNGSSAVTLVAPNEGAQASPTPLGVSGGNALDSGSGQCSGGTLGSLVSLNGNQYILGTSSVLARNDLGTVGDPIIQPSLTDAPTACSSAGTTTVANLSQFTNLEAPGANVDAALAQVVSGKVDPSGNILLLGTTGNPPGVGAPHAGSGVVPVVGHAVAKSGRATGLTCSTIEAIAVHFSPQYQKGYGAGAQPFQVSYTNLVQVSGVAFGAPNQLINVTGVNFSAVGDAGSLIVTADTADPVALLIASSSTGDTLANPVSDVLPALGNPVFVGSASPHIIEGCGIFPAGRQSFVVTRQAALSSETLLQATAVRNIHATELLSNAGVHAVGVNSSSDDPNALAIELFVTKDFAPGSYPTQIDGLRTKIVKVGAVADRGVLSVAESSILESSAIAPTGSTFISDSEVARARAVQDAHVDELMKLEGVQGVGITSSADNPAEAALMIYVIQGAAHAEIPAVIEGVRTRIKASSPFVAIGQ